MEDLFADLVCLGVEGGDLLFLFAAQLLFARDVFDDLFIPVFALGERLFVFRALRAQLFGGDEQLGDALFHRLFLRGEGADVLADLGEVFDGVDDAALRFVGQRLVFGELLIQLLYLFGEGGAFALRRGDLLFQLFRGGESGGALFGDRRKAAARGFRVGGVGLALLFQKGDALTDEVDVALLFLHIDGVLQDLVSQLLQELVALGKALSVLFVAAVERLDAGTGFVDLTLHARGDGVDLRARVGRVVVLVDIEIDLALFELAVQFAVFFRLFRLPREGGEHMLDLAHPLQEDVEVVVGVGEAALDVLPAGFEDDDARRLFEDGAAVFGLGVHDLLDLALPDDGVALFAEADRVEAVYDVFHAAGLLVDEIFALAAAEETAGERDLVVFEVGEHLRVIVEGVRDLAERLALPLLGAAENNVLHVRAAHGFCRLLAEYPADRVRHVALAAAVRPHDAGDAVIEFYFGLVRKGLETVEFDFFEVQSSYSPL